MRVKIFKKRVVKSLLHVHGSQVLSKSMMRSIYAGTDGNNQSQNPNEDIIWSWL